MASFDFFSISENHQNDFLTLVAEDKQMVAYRPQWREITGSVTATILLQQIIFRWNTAGRRPFYKFKTPSPDNSMYKKGDSWLEEIGFGRKEFDNAIKKIGQKLSRRKLEDDPSLLDHDSPVEYCTDEKHVTWYNIHERNLRKFLGQLYILPEDKKACEHEECPLDSLNDERDIRKSANGTLGEVPLEHQEKSERDISRSTNGAFDPSPLSDISRSTNGAMDQTEITTERIPVTKKTATEKESAVEEHSYSQNFQKTAKNRNGNRTRKFEQGIEDYIQRTSMQYERFLEYPENLSDLCREDEFYELIKRNPAVLATLADNLHKASKDEEIGNIVGWARKATREQIRSGMIGQSMG